MNTLQRLDIITALAQNVLQEAARLRNELAPAHQEPTPRKGKKRQPEVLASAMQHYTMNKARRQVNKKATASNSSPLNQ